MNYKNKHDQCPYEKKQETKASASCLCDISVKSLPS